MYVRNHVVVPEFAWYFLIRMGWGTGNRPTNVPCWRNLRISLSSVRPLESDMCAVTINKLSMTYTAITNKILSVSVCKFAKLQPCLNLIIPCIGVECCLPQNCIGQQLRQSDYPGTWHLLWTACQTWQSLQSIQPWYSKCIHSLMYCT